MKKAVEEKDMKKEVEKKSAKTAVEEKEVKKVADEKPVKKAAADKETKKVAEEKTAKKAAADEKVAKKAVAEKETKKAAEAKPAKKAAEEKEVKKPAEDKKTAKAAEDKKAKKAAEEEVADEIVEEETEAVTRPGIVEIYKGKEYKDKDGNVKEDFYFTFRSFHGYLIGRSQGYSTKDSCKNGVQAVMNACAAAEVFDNAIKKPIKNYSPKFGKAMFEMYKDTEGKFRFRLFAKNAENVAASFGYKTKANLKSGIESLKRIATNYTLKDSTLKKKPDADKA